MDEKKTTELLSEIRDTLNQINNRQDTIEVFSESDKLIGKAESRVEHATNQIQNTFDRIHDKVFNFNNILIAAFIALGTFPSDSPKLELWTVIFPIINLIYMVLIDIRQMEIHRFAAREMEWTSIEREQYGKKISTQTFLSLGSFLLSIGCLIYLIIVLI